MVVLTRRRKKFFFFKKKMHRSNSQATKKGFIDKSIWLLNWLLRSTIWPLKNNYVELFYVNGKQYARIRDYEEDIFVGGVTINISYLIAALNSKRLIKNKIFIETCIYPICAEYHCITKIIRNLPKNTISFKIRIFCIQRRADICIQ